MTRNQIDALRLQEEKRANQAQEGIKKSLVPAEYISSLGSVLRGFSGFKKSAGPRNVYKLF